MDGELKRKWLQALRGGDYGQGDGALRRGDDTYCCLGVLCDVSGLGHWERRPGGDAALGYDYVVGASRRPHTPDSEVGGFEFLTKEVIETLTDMNDLHRKTFREIADHIEENL